MAVMKRTEESSWIPPANTLEGLTDDELVALYHNAPWDEYKTSAKRLTVNDIAKHVYELEGQFTSNSCPESLALDLVRARTTIPVPRVRRCFRRRGNRFIVMDYIEGETLDKCWARLPLWRKAIVAWKLRSYVRQLRSIRFRSVEMPGPLGDGPQLCEGEEYFFSVKDAGPFATYEALAEWYNGRARVTRKHAPPAMRKEVIEPFDDSQPLTFCHLDLGMHNIILDKVGTLWLIDWGRSGFYPPWFEFVAARRYRGRYPSWLWDYLVVPCATGWYWRQLRFMTRIQFAMRTGVGAKA